MSPNKKPFNDLIKKGLQGLVKTDLLKIKSKLVNLYLTLRECVLKNGNEIDMAQIDDDYQRKLTEINKAIFRLKIPVEPRSGQKKKNKAMNNSKFS